MLAVGAAALVATGDFVLMEGGVALLGIAVRYIDTGGLGLMAGALILPCGVLAVLLAASSFAGVGLALRGDRRFRFLSASSGIAVLVWWFLAMGSRTGPELAWLMAIGSGAGLLLLLGWWLTEDESRP